MSGTFLEKDAQTNDITGITLVALLQDNEILGQLHEESYSI